jgi:hypothetical protein
MPNKKDEAITKDVVDHIIHLTELSLKLIREFGQWEKRAGSANLNRAISGVSA